MNRIITQYNLSMPYELAPLPYAADALEPAIDALTMTIHHDKHHAAYVAKFNSFLTKHPELADRTLEQLLQDIDTLPIDPADRTILRNHGGGTYNHQLFWDMMAPQKAVDQTLQSELAATFGSVTQFKEQFATAATNHFGSGWAWLVRDATGKLQIYSLPNQDCPLSQGHTPILGLDVWEPAYSLKYKNRRADYIAAWWRVVKMIE